MPSFLHRSQLGAVVSKYLFAALTGSLPSAVTQSKGSENFPVQRVPWSFKFFFGILTNVINHLLSRLGSQAIGNVKIKPSEGHGQQHLTLAKLWVSVIRLCCNSTLKPFKVVPLSHQRDLSPHIQCPAFLMKLWFLSSTTSVREGGPCSGGKNGQSFTYDLESYAPYSCKGNLLHCSIYEKRLPQICSAQPYMAVPRDGAPKHISRMKLKTVRAKMSEC